MTSSGRDSKRHYRVARYLRALAAAIRRVPPAERACEGPHAQFGEDRILERMKEHDFKGVRREGYGEARWVLMDFGDVVAHVFDPEDRQFYGLEEFWEREKPLAAA